MITIMMHDSSFFPGSSENPLVLVVPHPIENAGRRNAIVFKETQWGIVKQAYDALKQLNANSFMLHTNCLVPCIHKDRIEEGPSECPYWVGRIYQCEHPVEGGEKWMEVAADSVSDLHRAHGTQFNVDGYPNDTPTEQNIVNSKKVDERIASICLHCRCAALPLD